MRRLIPLCAALALAACNRGPEPSTEYQDAKKLFDATCSFKESGDDCFGDEKIGEAEDLLRRVKENSADFTATVTLLAKIEAGKKDLKERLAEEAADDEGAAPEPDFAFTGGGGAPAAVQPPPISSDLPLDATLEQFQAKYAGCVEKKLPFREEGGKSGDAWGMIADKAKTCAEKFPSLPGWYYLFADGKLHKPVLREETSVGTVTEKVDAGPQ